MGHISNAFSPTDFIQGDTKKTELTKSLITPEMFSVWNKNSIELCTTYEANICKVSILYNKNSLFYSSSKIYDSRCAPRHCRQTWIHLTKFPPPLSGWVWLLLWWLLWGQGWSGGCANTPFPWGNTAEWSLGGSGLVSAVTTPDSTCGSAGERFWNISLSGCRSKSFCCTELRLCRCWQHSLYIIL